MVVFIKWLAHASFQIRAEGKIIYVDLEEYGEASEMADLILVTHSHTDHCDPSKIKKVRRKGTVIIAPKDCVSKIGGNIKTLKPGEETTVDGIRVRAVDAYNYKRFRSPGNPYHPKEFGVGYLITVENKTVYHAGDTDFIPEMRQLGHVDVALLPSGDTYTMDNVEAAEAAIAINPKIAIPMHRWNINPEDFRKKVEVNSNVKIMLLQEGEEFQVA
ncbi:MAG: MBL fold metallo-hydrolase [Candidatus Bathyarchaeota archaeon]|nr:MBL fold metallo-hydrolase [Candidatus Bathyarchaeota archaeon]MDH5495210.1 MBL fold metallo-hydrolase [Candidatus Bathyarchaeota archaeon]